MVNASGSNEDQRITPASLSMGNTLHNNEDLSLPPLMIYALWTEVGDVHRSMIQQPARLTSINGCPIPPHKLVGLNSNI